MARGTTWVEVVVRHGATVLDVVHLDPRRAHLVLGSRRGWGSDLVGDADLDGATEHVLVTWDGVQPLVHAQDAWVPTGGRRRRRYPGGATLAATRDDPVAMAIGPITVRVREVLRPVGRPGAPSPWQRTMLAARALLLLALGIGWIATAWRLPPALLLEEVGSHCGFGALRLDPPRDPPIVRLAPSQPATPIPPQALDLLGDIAGVDGGWAGGVQTAPRLGGGLDGGALGVHPSNPILSGGLHGADDPIARPLGHRSKRGDGPSVPTPNPPHPAGAWAEDATTPGQARGRHHGTPDAGDGEGDQLPGLHPAPLGGPDDGGDHGATPVQRMHPHALVRLVLVDHEPAFRHCWQRRLGIRPDLAGEVVLTFAIDDAGATRDVAIASSALDDARTERCLVARMAQVRFPELLGGETTVRYPMRFARSS